jgi:ligand-binding sensor domain-containing protein/signal transduction histidine kinase
MKWSSYFPAHALCLILAMTTAFGQTEFEFKHISTPMGLSQRTIYSMCQDREGFIWFGSEDGLNKFDGYRFVVFKPDPSDPTHTLRHNIISALHEDRKGRLWVATLGGGLHQIDKRTGKVTAFAINPVSKANWNVISAIYEDPQGMLWLSSNGLARFDPDTKQYKLFPLTKFFNRLIGGDSLGRLWYQSSGKLNRFDPKTGTSRSFPLPSANAIVRTSYIDAKGILWMGTTRQGLFWADTRTDTPRFKLYTPKGKMATRSPCQSIYEDRSRVLWVATDEGLLRINRKYNEVFSIPSAPWRSGGLGENLSVKLFADRANNLWIGGYNGIYKLTAHHKPFKSYQLRATPVSVQLGSNRLTSLLQDHTGAVWLANTGDDLTGYGLTSGLYRADSMGKLMKRISLNPYHQHVLVSDTVTALCEDHAGRVWVGTAGALLAYNRTTGLFTQFPAPYLIRRIKEDKEGKLWFSVDASEKRGIASFDPVHQHFSYYLFDPKDTTGLKGGAVRNILVSHNNEIWLAHGGAGIARLNQQTNKFTTYQASPTFQAGQLNDKDTRALYEDPAGTIWVGTNQGGLNRLDPQTGRFTYLTTQDGLPSNHIASIIGDNHGNLWIGTNNGLCRFTPSSKTCRNFDVSDGLPDNEFTLGTVQKHNGRLLFGTLNGYVVFNPDSIRDNRTIPPVYITHLNVLDKPRDLLSNHIELPYSDNYLSFEFVALNYNTSEKNQYAYQLEGVDQAWVYSGSRRFASYTELGPGTYVFRVKASNNDGVWNQKGTALYFTILPPWWRTWWAYALYGLLFIGGVWSFIAYRSRKLQEENRLLEKKIALRTSQLEHKSSELEHSLINLKATQTQLIQREKMASLGELTSGIAHEIQNPLNFVNNFSEVSTELVGELREEEAKTDRDPDLIGVLLDDLTQNLDKITHHGGRASAIVKGMLGHSRPSSGEREPTNLNALCEEYVRLAYQGLRAKDKTFNADLNTDFDPNLGKVDVVPQEIGRVLLNLYNNAFYAVGQRTSILAEGETYAPTVWVSTHLLPNAVEIRIKDNGTGIPDAIKAKVFQPFFTTKPTGEGTGLGLSLSYDIITKGHGGTLMMESVESEGTTFIVSLPSTPIE